MLSHDESFRMFLKTCKKVVQGQVMKLDDHVQEHDQDEGSCGQGGTLTRSASPASELGVS